jgi:hypothetical protein
MHSPSAAALLLLVSPALAFHAALRPHSGASPTLVMAAADTRQKIVPKGLPPAIADRISFATSGIKTANQIQEVEVLWKTFRSVYATEELAIEAVTKNAAVLQPQLNSPTKIKGTYKLLRDRFGKAGAADVIQRNPGVLVCSPQSMAKQTDEEILKAVELVEMLDDNKELIKAVSITLYLSFVALIAYIITAKGHPEYGLWLIGQ